MFSLVGRSPARRDPQNLIGGMARIANVPVPKAVVRVIGNGWDGLGCFGSSIARDGSTRCQIKSRTRGGEHAFHVPILAQISQNALVLIAIDVAKHDPYPVCPLV